MESYGGNKRVKFQKLWLAELAWFDAGQHSPVGSQHGFVDVSLRLRKLAIGWKRARDVRRVAVILSAHIKQTVATEAHKCTYARTRTTLTCTREKNLHQVGGHR